VPGPVTLGVRPEDILIGAEQRPERPIRARVEVAELMGNESILYLAVGEDTIVARVPPRVTPKPGDLVDIRFDTPKLHFFNPATGATLI